MDNLDQAIERYLPYLQEIQKKLLLVVILLVLSGSVGFIYYQPIIKFFMGLFQLNGITIVFTSPYQFLNLAINTALVVGVTVSLPLLLFFIITFLKPALKPREYSLLIKLYPLSILFFAFGFAFGVWIMQFVITLYAKTSVDLAIGNYWDIGNFISQILSTGLCLALVFELPLILLALLRINLITHAQVTKQRRYIYAGILLVSALLPPTDILSMFLLTIPPLFLFESTLVLNKMLGTKG